MAKDKPGYLIVVQLDPRMALEAIIGNRLERIPATRRQEWLRGLLMQGFRAECLALRSVPEKRERSSTPPFTQWLAGKVPGAATSTSAPPGPRTGSERAETNGKPFAALGKVMG